VPSDHAAPLDDEIVRVRLVERLAARWAVPVVIVEAPGGFGKSIALAQAYRANRADPAGVDVHVACRVPERDAGLLAQRVAERTGIALPPTADAAELAGALASGLATLGPTQVAIMLDDVHHLVDGGDARHLLAELVRCLPTNAHLVVSGRRIPALPLARLQAADRVVRLDQRELAFDGDETAALAERHGRDPDALELAAGWPALTRLAIVVGASAPLDFLMEEVVHGLDHPTRVGLAATVLGHHVDDVVLQEVASTPVSTADLLATVPLVSPEGRGRIRAHDLWGEVVDHLLDADELADLAVRMSCWHLEHGRHGEAIEAAATVGAWDQARRAVLAALEVGDAELRASRTATWLAVFPPDQHDEPELLLLRGISRRMAGDLHAARPDVEAALARFRERGHATGQASAGLEVGLLAWLLGDVGRVLEMVQLAEELQQQGDESMSWMIEMARAGFADLGGDSATALAHLERIDVDALPGPTAQLVWRWMSTLRMLLGDSAGAVEVADELHRRDPGEHVRLAAAIAHWQHGDPEWFRGDVAASGVLPSDNARDDFQIAVYRAVVDASIGIAFSVEDVVDLANERGRDRAFVAVARAASLVAAGDESAASAVLRQLVDDGGLDDGPCLGELRRFQSLCVPLCPRIGAALDGHQLGPRHRDRWALAQLMVDARAGEPVDWIRLPPPPDVLTGLPLRWSLELAARAAADGHPAGGELAAYLLDFAGPPAQELLRALRGDPRIPTAGVEALLASAPGLPATTVRITACGPLTVDGVDGTPTALLRRVRVRELLGLLILRDRVTATQAVELLWPGLDPDNGRNNLRITVSYLRRLLEPDRVSGRPSYHVRRRGDDLWLERSALLDVDVWRIRGALAAGRTDEQLGHLARAMVAYRGAVDAWTDELLVDLRQHPDLAPEVTYLDLELESAAARLAEWSLNQGDELAAEAVAGRLLAHDPYAERAHAVIISARLARDEVVAAGEAVARCRAALDELGVEPSPSTELLIRRFERLART
jgi:DNA-binding SARP family transcriptional activator